MATDTISPDVRMVLAVHGRKEVTDDPQFEAELADFLTEHYDPSGLTDLYSRFTTGEGRFDALMRRIIWRASAKHVGGGLNVGTHVSYRHLDTLSLGRGVSIGAHACIHGRFDGNCSIGDHVWIGPQAFLDARDLIIEDHVGWGHGAKVLGSEHTAMPIDIPIIQTDLAIRPVRIGARADIGVGAVVLPGVSIGHDSIIGAGSIVTRNVPPFAIVAGTPARFMRWRDGHQPDEQSRQAASALSCH